MNAGARPCADLVAVEEQELSSNANGDYFGTTDTYFPRRERIGGKKKGDFGPSGVCPTARYAGSKGSDGNCEPFNSFDAAAGPLQACYLYVPGVIWGLLDLVF